MLPCLLVWDQTLWRNQGVVTPFLVLRWHGSYMCSGTREGDEVTSICNEGQATAELF